MLTFEYHQVRAIVFVDQSTDGKPAGQQVQCWLPSGEYQPVCLEAIKIDDPLDQGSVTESQAVRLHRHGCVFYVAPHQVPEDLVVELNQKSKAGQSQEAQSQAQGPFTL